MPRAQGANARVRLKRETTEGTAPSGNYNNMPFFAPVTLGSEQGLIDDNLLGQGRDPQDPFRDVINVGGDVTVPIDSLNIGLWLTGLLGTPTTVDNTTHKEHTFESGASSLPSYSIEVGYPDLSTPEYFMNSGVKVNSMGINFDRTGAAKATFNLIGISETPANSSGAGTPTSQTLTLFNMFQASITRNGSALASITSATLDYSNNMEAVQVLRADGLAEGVDPSIASLTGNLSARFADTTLLDDATNGDAVDLELALTIDSDNAITFTCPRVFLPKPKVTIDGPGGVQVGFDFRGAYDSTEGAMFIATLLNSDDGSLYA